MGNGLKDVSAPRTTTDLVFDHLFDEIVSLRILPNSKISEAEVANRLGVSRQPVRDAFNRLGNLELLQIRPQRPTLVRGFSFERIKNVRFMRMAIELEVIRDASRIWNDACAERLEANMVKQREAIAAGQIDEFHRLDYEFHQAICELSGHGLAFETIRQCKQQIDRLCVLSLARQEEASAVLNDHEEMAGHLKARATDAAIALMRSHLSRLGQVIEEIHETHSEYFE